MAHLIDKLPLEGVDIWVEVPKLDEPQLAQLRHAAVGRLRLEEELAERHLLAPEEAAALQAHGRRVPLHGRVLLVLLSLPACTKKQKSVTDPAESLLL